MCLMSNERNRMYLKGFVNSKMEINRATGAEMIEHMQSSTNSTLFGALN